MVMQKGIMVGDSESEAPVSIDSSGYWIVYIRRDGASELLGLSRLTPIDTRG